MKAALSETQRNKYGTTKIYDDGTTLNDYNFLCSLIQTHGIGRSFLNRLNKWLKKQRTFNVGQIAILDNKGRQNKQGQIIDVHFYRSVKPLAILAQAKKYKDPILQIKIMDKEYSYNPNADTYYKPEEDDAGTAQANDQDNYYIGIYFKHRGMSVSTYFAEKYPEVLKSLHLAFSKHFNRHACNGVRLSIVVPKDGAIMQLVKDYIYPRHRLGFALDSITKDRQESDVPWPSLTGVAGELEATIRNKDRITIPALAKEAGTTKKTVYRWLRYIKKQVRGTHEFTWGAGNKAGYFEKVGQ